jgi:hypothetical protein
MQKRISGPLCSCSLRYRHLERSLLVGYAAQRSRAGLEKNVRDVDHKLRRRGPQATGLAVRGSEIARVEATQISKRP